MRKSNLVVYSRFVTIMIQFTRSNLECEKDFLKIDIFNPISWEGGGGGGVVHLHEKFLIISLLVLDGFG